MEPSAGAGSFAKALSVLKDLPLWLLSGVALTLILFRCIPALRGNIPVSTLPWLTLATLLFTILSMFRLGNVLLERRRVELQETMKRERHIFEQVYSPIYPTVCFLYITTYSNSGIPLRQRLSNALNNLLTKQRRCGAIRNALKAIFDKGIRTSGEVEYGGFFPLDQIIDIVLNNHALVDERLMELVRLADYFRNEDPHEESELTSADLDLYEHIITQYSRLKKKYGK